MTNPMLFFSWQLCYNSDCFRTYGFSSSPVVLESNIFLTKVKLSISQHMVINRNCIISNKIFVANEVYKLKITLIGMAKTNL